MKGNSKLRIVSNGIFAQNPTFRLVLGMCPTLAITTSAFNGLGMGLAATLILICSNALVSLLRKVIPDKVRIPAYVLIIATFVTLLEMILKKFIPTLYSALGIYLPLIVVNCIILARAEAFASSNKVGDSILDGLGMGLGFTLALTCLGFVRELVGSGTIFAGSLGYTESRVSLFGNAEEWAYAEKLTKHEVVDEHCADYKQKVFHQSTSPSFCSSADFAFSIFCAALSASSCFFLLFWSLTQLTSAIARPSVKNPPAGSTKNASE